ncbi:NAD(P)H-dependent glycerol-3-phosphate dehydrogenase [uncultured Anaerococcus sp.]|uniref:NAD(P)H-dependent glycerol-3-phosphate dehydrogenase n=1 Tax=uncultured Anaerococcus sp. TaxID=293428 RepID=UPI00288A826D|nr:NAD(P)H-dependent glycerol-3-phosphate dehydrogenase [uncultured Anaerococcus sp.]
MTISILGAGSWSTAIANLLAEKEDVLIYARDEMVVSAINNDHINIKYFPDVKLSEKIKATSSLEDIFKNKYLVNGIPTQQIRNVLNLSNHLLTDNHIVINLSKGLELGSHKRISEIFRDFNHNISFVTLSGPSHAEEVILKMPTAVVSASEDIKLAKEIQELFVREYFRVYSSNDLVGVELGGAIKNILAFGIGMAQGLGYGDNAKAALITRGIHEMSKFACVFGAEFKTINGLAGVGDLIVTATSKHSRNNGAGILVGQGLSLEELQNKIKMVVEGIPTTESVYELAKEKNIELPITNEIYKVLFENKDCDESVKDLMKRDIKSEF